MYAPNRNCNYACLEKQNANAYASGVHLEHYKQKSEGAVRKINLQDFLL